MLPDMKGGQSAPAPEESEEQEQEKRWADAKSQKGNAYLCFVYANGRNLYGYFIPNAEKFGSGTFFIPIEHHTILTDSVVLSPEEMELIVENNDGLNQDTILGSLMALEGESLSGFGVSRYSVKLSGEVGVRIYNKSCQGITGESSVRRFSNTLNDVTGLNIEPIPLSELKTIIKGILYQ